LPLILSLAVGLCGRSRGIRVFIALARLTFGFKRDREVVSK